MPETTEQVIIEFIADLEQFTPAEKKLERLGKIDKETADTFRKTTTELNKRVKTIDNVASSTTKVDAANKKVKGSVADLSKAFNSFTADLEEGFKEGMLLELEKAGVSLEDFTAGLKKLETQGTKAPESIKRQMRLLRDEMAALKVAGQDNTEQYKRMAAEAANLEDAIGDVAAETRRMASDTQGLDTAIDAATGLAAAFSIAEGSTQLLGISNRSLQETLVRVQSAMAVLTGLQTLQNLVQKESNLIRLITVAQTKALAAATTLETAATSKNIIVKKAATVTLRVLNTVMKANPALLLVSAFAALAGAIAYFSRKTDEAAESVEVLNERMEQTNEIRNQRISQLDVQGKQEIARLKEQGATEEKIHGATILNLVRQRTEYEKTARAQFNANKDRLPTSLRTILTLEQAEKSLREIRLASAQAAADGNEKLSKNYETQKLIVGDLVDGLREAKNVSDEIAQTNVDFSSSKAEKARQEADARRKEVAKKETKDLQAIELQRLNDIKTNIERQLLLETEATEKRLKLQQDLAAAEKDIKVFSAKSLAEQQFALTEFFVKAKEIAKEFYDDQELLALQSQENLLKAQLESVTISANERARLTEQLLNVQMQMELNENEDNQEKITEIHARFDRQRMENRFNELKNELQREQQLERTENAARNRLLRRERDNPETGEEDRKKANRDLFREEQRFILQEAQLYEKLYKDKIISADEYLDKRAELVDAELILSEEFAERDVKITEEAAAQKLAIAKEYMDNVIGIAQQGLSLLSEVFTTMSAQEDSSIERQKDEVQRLRETGAITEKEEKERMRRIDAEEKRIKQQQAQRDKGIAIFQAIINTAAAIAKALPNLVLAGIVGAMGAVQVGLIAARPIPRFGKGKKDRYEGLAEVGETGAELIEVGGKMYVADKPQLVYLTKESKVYNPKETKEIISMALPDSKKGLEHNVNTHIQNMLVQKTDIDYTLMGKAIAKAIPKTSINIDENGFKEWVKEGESLTKYLNNRRSF